MAPTPRTLADLLPEFRAPPPSPAAGAHDGDPDPLENDEFSGFLNRSLRAPQLILPDRILRREAPPPPWTPPEIDLRSYDAEVLRSAARSAGCFQIVGHGIEKGLIEEVRALAGRVFRLPPESKREVTRSEEREWGFEAEEEGDDDGEEELFWWSGKGDEELAGIWPHGYEDFRYKMQYLWTKMERIANKIAMDLIQNDSCNAKLCSSQSKPISGSSAISLHIHNRSIIHGVGRGSTPKHDILRMMIRNATCSHFLCLHICQGAFRFCAYSKNGWISFPVNDEAVIVTFGDQIQAWSDGRYKHVIGKANFQNKEKDVISVGYLHSHPSIVDTNVGGEGIISLAQQIIIAACILFISVDGGTRNLILYGIKVNLSTQI